MEKLIKYYPEHSYLIVKITSKKFIKNELKSKSVVNWGQGKIGQTDYFLLAECSPRHFGDKSQILVCKDSVAKEIQKQIDKE